MPVFIGCKIDRVKLHLLIPKPLLAGVKKGLAELCGQYSVKLSLVSTKNGDRRIAKFFKMGSRSGMRVILERCFKDTYIKYDFNPNNIEVDDLCAFIVATQCLAYGSYSHILSAGKVKELEVAIDCLYRHTSQYLFHKLGAEKSAVYTDGKQKGGSCYLGSRESGLYVIVYDKAEERIAVGMPYPFSEVLRIEARCDFKVMKVKNLGGLKNSFLKIIVSDIAVMKKTAGIVDAGTRKNFIDLAMKEGVPGALQKFSEVQRKQLRLLLRASAASWWDPVKAFQGFTTRAKKQLQVDFAQNLMPQ